MEPGAHVFDRNGYLAGTDEDRLADVVTMLCREDIHAVLCARGGYGCHRILHALPYGEIAARPKILVGYSDITALHLALYARTGLVSFHGPNVRDLLSHGEGNASALLDLLAGEAGETLLPLAQGRVLRQGQARGPLLGGNLTLLCHLLGTPFLPRLDGAILLLEDRGEALYRVDRMLTHLRLSGILGRISGLVFGEFLGCADEEALMTLFSERTEDLRVPVVTGAPVGHGPRNAAFPLGVPAELDTDAGLLRIPGPWVS